MISKLGMDIQTRKKKLQQLLYIGYTKKEIQKSIYNEVTIFYGLVLLLPFLYEFVIIIKVLSFQQITMSLAILLLLIQAIPTCLGYIITLLMYKQQIPK
jgi:hypothetical protein